MTRKSHKWTNLCNNKSQIPFVLDTISLQHYILLHSVKYIYLITFIILSVPSHHFIYGGVLELNRIVVVYLLTYISQSADYLRVHSTTVPSVACQTTEGEYLAT